MKPKRIAVVGAGLIGIRHIECAIKTRDAELAAIVDVTEAAAKIAQSYSVPYFNDIEKMINSVKPDGVIISTPNELHIENAYPCIIKDIPVLIEKPLATDLPEARNLLELAEEKHLPVLTGFFRRYNSIVQATKNQIHSGRIGQIVSVHSHFWLYKNSGYFDNIWRRSKGAGPININLSHDIDLLLYFLGDIEYLNAYASNSTRQFEVEDTAVIIAQFRNSALCTINMSDSIPSPWSWELTAGDNPAYPKTDQLYCMIGGTKGSIEMPNNKLWYYSDERHWYRPISSEVFMKTIQDSLCTQMEHFIDVIRGEAQPLASGQDGLKVMEVIEAIKLSIEEERKVYLSEI